MHVTLVTIDNTETFNDEVYVSSQVNSALVEDLINSLDGKKHSLLTLSTGGEEHMEPFRAMFW